MTTRLPILTFPIIDQREYIQRVLSVRPSNLIGAWLLDQASGFAATNLKPGTFTGELGSNGDLEGGIAYWPLQVGTGAIADEAVLVHGGAKAAKLTAGSSANTYLFENIRCNPSSTVTLKFWTRGDGTYAGRYAVRNWTTQAWIVSLKTTGVTGTDYTEVTEVISVPATCNVIQIYFYCPSTNSGIAYFDDITVTGTVNADGGYGLAAYTTYGQPGIGDGKTSVKLTGITGQASGITIGSGYFNSVWNGNKGSAIAWGKIDAAGTWTDNTIMRYLFHVKSEGDPTYYVVMAGKNQASYQVEWRRRVGGTIYTKTYTFSPSGPTTWYCMGFRWNVTDSPINMAGFLYVPGVLAWTKIFDETPTPGTGDGAWGTNPVRSDAAALGGGLFTSQVYKGWQAHSYCWAGAALTDADFRKAMVP
jgi:hypothetical protein